MIQGRAVEQLLLIGRYFEGRGDAIRAIGAYREVVLHGDAEGAARARQRLAELAGAWAPRPG